jgi:hypothetical protein
MAISKESKIKAVFKQNSIVVNTGTWTKAVHEDEWDTVVRQILSLVQPNSETQPHLKQDNVSRRFIVGQKIPMKEGRWLKIMADADGYYMARYKGCMPFCCTEKELISRLEQYGYLKSLT